MRGADPCSLGVGEMRGAGAISEFRGGEEAGPEAQGCCSAFFFGKGLPIPASKILPLLVTSCYVVSVWGKANLAAFNSETVC